MNNNVIWTLVGVLILVVLILLITGNLGGINE